MEKFEYAIYMFYLILSIIVLAFLVYVAPAFAAEVRISSQRAWENLVKVEWVERLLLAIEEAREWHSEPGRHRQVTFGAEFADAAYFIDLGKMWEEVEETLRVDLKKKVIANVR